MWGRGSCGDGYLSRGLVLELDFMHSLVSYTLCTVFYIYTVLLVWGAGSSGAGVGIISDMHDNNMIF